MRVKENTNKHNFFWYSRYCNTYESFEIHTGKMFQNKSLLPNNGTNLSYSFTPSHTESKYYSWEDKHVANFSVDLNDEYNLELKKIK